MSDIDELKAALEKRWAAEDVREQHQDETLRHLTDEYARLHESVRKLEMRVDGTNELATRTSKSAYGLEELMLAKLAFLQNSLEESKTAAAGRRAENIAGYAVVAVLVVVGSLVGAHVIPVAAFVPTVGGLLAAVLAALANHKRKSSGKSIPPPPYRG